MADENAIFPLTIEQKLIQAAIDFANSKNTAPASVEGRFSRFMPLKRTLERDSEAYASDQEHLRARLEQIHENWRKALKDTRADINEMLQEKCTASLRLTERGLQYSFSATGVEGAYALALAFLFHTGLASDLRRCLQCSRFFVIFDPKRKRQRYCSAQCTVTAQRVNAVARVQRHRSRQKAKPKRR